MKALALLLTLPLLAAAHPADVTPLRVEVERQALEFRFTVSLYTLGRLVPLLAGEDRRLDLTELEAARSALEKFLQEQVVLSINEHQARLGDLVHLEPLWPGAGAVDASQMDRSVDATFRLRWPEVIGSVKMKFTGFAQLGELATLQATYEQGDLRMQVPFSRNQPEYLYDTGFQVEHLFVPAPPKPPANKPPEIAVRLLPWVAALLACVFLSPLLRFFRKPGKGKAMNAP